MTNYFAALLLFLLPAITVELLSGNTPLTQYCAPQVFFCLNILYGAAAVIVRESLSRWKTGFASMMLLGIAYGMINEGFCSKGLFDPHFYAVAAFGLEGVGRYFGINAAWGVSIIAIHTIFSISVPITLVSSIFTAKSAWLKNGEYYSLVAIFAIAVVIAEMSFGRPFVPAFGPSALIFLIVCLFVMAGRVLPDISLSKFRRQPANVGLFIFGAAYAQVLFFVAITFHRYCADVPLQIGALLGLLFLFLWVMLKLPVDAQEAKFMLASGLLMPQILQSLGRGNWVISILVATLLCVLWKNISTPKTN